MWFSNSLLCVGEKTQVGLESRECWKCATSSTVESIGSEVGKT